jgi:hypothetical protein
VPAANIVYAAVINGVAAVPLLVLVARTAGSERIMAPDKRGWLSNVTRWLTFLGTGAAAIATLVMYDCPWAWSPTSSAIESDRVPGAAGARGGTDQTKRSTPMA